MNKIIIFLLITILSFASMAQQRNPANQAIYLEDISWTEAQKILNNETVVVIPLGAASKEHGPHLPLATDFIQAEGLAKRVALERKVVITPVVSYGFYPAFLKYPGSTSTTFATATNMVVEIVRSLAGYGPRRFYIINVGVSTTPTLETAAKTLAEEGILLYYSQYSRPAFEIAEANFRTKAYSGHADEIETSNVLSLRPDLVDMTKAVNDSSMKGKSGNMTPIMIETGNLNTSGINGYAALGTKEKGQKNMASFANELIKEIDSITTCALPKVKNRTEEYAAYEGTYKDATGRKLEISQKENMLYFIWNGRDTRNFFHLYKDAPDYFSSMNMNILFVKNEAGVASKAWCQFRGERFWVTRVEK
ncbi:creatininase family protein [Emticicia sp. BO119]|uniref:creatininase family protein n=1 Tax=Emticicia sp. BO119 TaxID=2757768 RepID=UPI0015F11CC9|nr:creatininase family protein [Emticicia sp. BO119]MBA4850820.1 creatininase family protein [Emticicia sp. BO119]